MGASPSLQLSATDVDGDALTYSATGLPPGLGVNATSGLISGTIAAGAASGSPYTVTATVADGRGGSAQRTFTWTVSLAPNQPPSLAQPANQSHPVGASPSLQLSATDLDGDALTYSATGLPPGLGVNATSGLISGTIAAGAASGSPYTVTATVADGRGGSAQRTFTWTVSLAPNQPPSLAQPANQSHPVGASPSLQLSATDVDGDALTYSATGLPPGLGVNATSGLISGTIAAGAASGSPYTVTATVADGRGGSAQRTFTWTVSLPAPPPTPTGFVTTATTVDTALAWNAVGGVAGYNIYRAASSTGPYAKLNPTPITGTSYTDLTAPATTSSWYRVTAVSTGGTESAPASAVAHRRILLVGAQAGTNNVTSSLQISAPAGRQTNDFMLATITVRSSRTITPPSGWTLVRVDTSGTALRQAIYRRFVIGSEPSSYTWSFSGTTGAAGTIAVYRGVDTTTPIEANSGRVNGSSTQVPTNPITTATTHAAVVAMYGVAWNAALTVPDTLDERVAASMQNGQIRLAVKVADLVRPVPGSTGALTATSGRSAVSIGQLVALRPAGP